MPGAHPLLRCFGFALALCLLLGSQAMAQANENQTIQRYRLALQVDPDNPTLQYALGVALLQQDDTQEAISALRKAYPAYTDSVEMHYNMGLAFTRIGDPDSALLYLDQAEALGGLQPPRIYPLINALYNVALLYLERDDLSEAKTLLERVLQLDPSRIEIYRVLGDISARNGQDDEAIAHLTIYLEHYPNDPTAREYLYALHFNRAQKARESGDIQSARQEFSSALQLVPESPPVLYYLGEIDYQRGALSEAVPHLSHALPVLSGDLHDNTRAMLYNTALTALGLQQTDLALMSLAPLLASDQPRVKDLLLSGDIHLRRQEYLAARRDYNQVLALEPGNPQASLNLTAAEEGAVDVLFADGLGLFKSGSCQQAMALFDEILAIRPQDKRAIAFRDKCRNEIAIKADRAFTASSKALTAEDLLGAMAAVQQGLSLAPDNMHGLQLQKQILTRLESILQSMLTSGFDLLERNDFAAAEAQFKKVLELAPDNTQAEYGQRQAESQRQQAAQAAVVDGNLALDEGRLADARQSYSRAAVLAPGLASAREGQARLDALIATMTTQEIQWGRAARAAGQLDQARIHLAKALALQESDDVRQELTAIDAASSAEALALLQAARNERQKHNYKSARSLLNRAAATGNTDASRELAALEAEITELLKLRLQSAADKAATGSPQEAISLYRKVLELEPDNPLAMSGLKAGREQLEETIASGLSAGNAALAAGELESATSAFNRVLALDPYQSGAKSGLHRIATLQQSGVKPGDEQRLYLLGIELYTRGRYADAVEAWEQVLLIAPQHEKARQNIEKARRKAQSIKEFQGG